MLNKQLVQVGYKASSPNVEVGAFGASALPVLITCAAMHGLFFPLTVHKEI